jgi:DNA polymerase III subunit beta
MEIEVNKEIFLNAIQKAERVTGKGLSLPILSAILFETIEGGLCITATNSELGIQLSIPAKVAKPGKVAVPGNILSTYISSLGGDKKVTISQVGGTIKIQSQKAETAIKCMPSDDFPSIPKHENGTSLKISPKYIIEGIKSVIFCASQSSIKPELASVYIYGEGDMTFVATDSFRLAEKKIGLSKPIQDWSVLIPAKNATEIIRILEDIEEDVDMKVDTHQISFTKEGLYLTSRVVNGSFPDYRQIIPKESKVKLLALKQDIINAFRSVSIFSDKFFKLNFNIDPSEKKFSIKTSNADVGESITNVEATISGEPTDINFNFKYINDALPIIPSSSIELSLSPQGRLVMKGNSENSFMYIVMPMNR